MAEGSRVKIEDNLHCTGKSLRQLVRAIVLKKIKKCIHMYTVDLDLIAWMCVMNSGSVSDVDLYGSAPVLSMHIQHLMSTVSRERKAPCLLTCEGLRGVCKASNVKILTQITGLMPVRVVRYSAVIGRNVGTNQSV